MTRGRTAYIVSFALAAACGGEHAARRVGMSGEMIAPVLSLPEEIQTVPPSPPVAGCPDDMTLVEGNYCPDLEETCVRFAPLPPQYVGIYGKKCLEFAAPSRCLSEEKAPMRFCMDTYEYTSGTEGKLPAVMLDYHEMKAICEEKGKRLCSDIEHTEACRGPDDLPYTYGYARDNTACNTDRPNIILDPRLIRQRDFAEAARGMQREDVDARPRCKSGFGIYGLGGNVDEITENVSREGKPYRLALKTGHARDFARNQCTPATLVHNEGYAYPDIGGRCCMDAPVP